MFDCHSCNYNVFIAAVIQSRYLTEMNDLFVVSLRVSHVPLSQSRSIQPLPSPFLLRIRQSDPEVCGACVLRVLISAYQASYCQLPGPQMYKHKHTYVSGAV